MNIIAGNVKRPFPVMETALFKNNILNYYIPKNMLTEFLAHSAIGS